MPRKKNYNTVLTAISKMPDLYELRSRIHDIDGREIHPEAIVEVVSPIATGGRLDPVPVGEILTVLGRSGGAFRVEDGDGIAHVAQGVRLRILKPGNPELSLTELEFSSTGVPAKSSRMYSTLRGARKQKKDA